MICDNCKQDLGTDPELIDRHLSGNCGEAIKDHTYFSTFLWRHDPHFVPVKTSVIFELDAMSQVEVRDGEAITIELPLGIDFGTSKVKLKAGIRLENRGGIMYAVTPKTIVTKE